MAAHFHQEPGYNYDKIVNNLANWGLSWQLSRRNLPSAAWRRRVTAQTISTGLCRMLKDARIQHRVQIYPFVTATRSEASPVCTVFWLYQFTCFWLVCVQLCILKEQLNLNLLWETTFKTVAPLQQQWISFLQQKKMTETSEIISLSVCSTGEQHQLWFKIALIKK